MKHHLPKSNVVIKPARLQDLKIVFNFINELESSDFNISSFKKIYVVNLLDPNITYLLAWNKTIPIGFLSCHIQGLLHHNSRVAEIQEMFVAKEYRNRGVGVMLLEFLKSRLKRQKVNQLEVVSNRKRRKTHQFYLGNNFKWTSKKFGLKIK